MSTRKEILEMLSQGEIDVARATQLLNETREPEGEPAAPAPAAAPAPPIPPAAPAPPRAPRPPVQPVAERTGARWLHIHVSDLESGRQRVRVNVPLGLVNFGLKLGSRFTDELDSGMMHDVMDALKDPSITGTLVEVEDLDDNEHVHIFID